MRLRVDDLQRKALLERLREWGDTVHLHKGPYAVRSNILQTSFAEWLEVQEPGLFNRSFELISPLQFRRALHAAFPYLPSRSRKGRTDRTFFCLRYSVVTKDFPYESVQQECQTCGHRTYAWQKSRPKDSKEALIAEYKALEAGEKPTPKEAYIDDLLDRRFKPSR